MRGKRIISAPPEILDLSGNSEVEQARKVVEALKAEGCTVNAAISEAMSSSRRRLKSFASPPVILPSSA
jgi:hypothetical protein